MHDMHDMHDKGDGVSTVLPEARHAVRTPRAAAIAGIIFSVLLSISLLIIRLSVMASSRDLSSWLADSFHRNIVALALNLIPFAGIAFLWFIGVVRDHLGDREDRFFSTVFLGSGLLFIAMLFASAAVGGVLATNVARLRSRISRKRRLEVPASGNRLLPDHLCDAHGWRLHDRNRHPRGAHRLSAPMVCDLRIHMRAHPVADDQLRAVDRVSPADMGLRREPAHSAR